VPVVSNEVGVCVAVFRLLAAEFVAPMAPSLCISWVLTMLPCCCCRCVSVPCRDDADRAIRTLNGYGYDNLILHVEWAAPRAERT
jgi:hypothetical protein